jgi:hypothetical protein
MEQLLKAFIYIRVNSWFIIENVVKLGITATSLKDRDTPYITGEVERGEYIYVIEIPLNKMKLIDNYLKDYFKSHHIYKGGGTEFYDKCIVDLIEPCLKEINLEYRILTKEEINCMNRCERIRNIPNVTKVKNKFNQIKIENIIQKYKVKRSKKASTNNEIITDLSCVNNDIEPNEHQKYVLEMIEGFFTSYNIGKIIWACGLGKALLSILIVKLMKFKSVVIGVPGNNLQKQIKDEIIKIFPNKNNILFVGGDENDCIKSTTNKNKIIEFLNININTQPKFVISTYHSCHLLVDPDIIFDFKQYLNG